MIDIEKEQEIWKTYPEFPFIEANQFGEIRMKDRYVPCRNGGKRLVKGHVLKQWSLPSGYLYVHISVNGKHFNRYVHRIIATCFIPNPLGLPEINHIDNNHINNAISNLEWCTKQYNLDYKKNFGTSPAQIQGKHVSAVNLKTGKVIKFETRSEAAHQLGVNRVDIDMVIKGKLYQTGGYWFTEDESKITKKKIQEIKTNMRSCPVIAVKPKTSEVFWLESQHEAARQLGVDNSSICRIINGQQNRAGGYWFCRVDENSAEKVREKFGDYITCKVEELINNKI